MITIYCITYNEELLIQFMIDHYRSRFPNCNIIFYDNSSTDNTTNIAKKNNCEVRTYNSGGTLDDGLHIQIKNNCWKDASTDWVLTCDLDELLDINEEDLKKEEELGTTRIKSEGWHMVNLQDNFDIANIKYGTRNTGYDKYMLFNKKYIKEMNYGAGCHNCNSIGKIIDSKSYKMYHYKFINLELSIARIKETVSRLSENNKKNGWGFHACMRTEQQITDEFMNERANAIKIR
jgi:glycosyltransferase involved in cell wall biosynthesis